ncbi:MAG: energy transducer TonB [Candidatus Sulfotelmatobacter sp.]
MVLPLRLWTDEENGQNDAPLLAHTLDISPAGASLGGLREPLQSGQVITLQRGQNRNRFRVVWTKQLDVNEIRAGLESLEPGKKLWDINLPEEIIEHGPVAEDPVCSLEHKETDSVSTVPVSTASAAHVSEKESTSIQRFHRAAAKYLHTRWASVLAGMIVVSAAAVLIQELNPPALETASLQRPESTIRPAHIASPANPTKLKDAVKVVFAKGAEDAAKDFSTRVKVADAPRGHIIYPDAPEANLSGKVNLKVVIGMAGRVKEIWVLSGNRELAKAAIRAVRQWRYSQPERNGQAVEAETNVTIDFQGQDAVSIHFPPSPPISTQS